MIKLEKLLELLEGLDVSKCQEAKLRRAAQSQSSRHLALTLAHSPLLQHSHAPQVRLISTCVCCVELFQHTVDSDQHGCIANMAPEKSPGRVVFIGNIPYGQPAAIHVPS